MLLIVESILPIFLLVLLGIALKRMPFLNDGLWPGLETFGFYVVFPALLFLTLANADFSDMQIGAVGLSALLSIFIMFALLAVIYPFMIARGVTPASYTSIFQTASRWNAFVAMAIAERYLGQQGIAVVALVMAVNIVPINLVNVGMLLWVGGGNRSFASFVKKTATNPLILSCAAGLLMHLLPFGIYAPLEQAIDLLARSALGLGLLMVGAGLRIHDALKPEKVVLLASALKLLLMPALMTGLALLFGLKGDVVVLLAICGAVPTAMNGFLLARQMGGDAHIYAAVATIQTAASFFTIPAVLAVAEMVS
ncbi:AEC family transporter [Pseudohoeflea suaedae]|uniref:AEC family transporter n=1 Tax=Pseudohoeflea suaedae TaxID=877384 RepID=A0A4R5PR14_9HYPH|nr:AEC family transporter [Pseudohoeflea suaedae]TDH39141.1 AEC family transporter [Pseudohoeflea suaedae]